MLSLKRLASQRELLLIIDLLEPFILFDGRYVCKMDTITGFHKSVHQPVPIVSRPHHHVPPILSALDPFKQDMKGVVMKSLKIYNDGEPHLLKIALTYDGVVVEM